MKMLAKVVFVLAALTLISTTPAQSRSTGFDSSQYNMTVVSVIALEEACVRQGGICVRIEDCDPSNLVTVQAVLCPNQRHLGVECCYN